MLLHPPSRRLAPIAGGLAVLIAAVATPSAAQVRLGPDAVNASVRVMSWREIPFRTVVRQEHDFSCGSAALATLLTYHYGHPTSEAQAFTQMFADGDKTMIRKVGFSMLDMKHYAVAHGLAANGFRLTLDELAEANQPAIVLINLGPYRHFVVVKGVHADKVLIGDPALGLRIVPRAAFQKMWNGVALMIEPPAGEGPPRFNVAKEWAPWVVAPVGSRPNADVLAQLTLTQLTLFQISNIRTLSSAEPGD